MELDIHLHKECDFVAPLKDVEVLRIIAAPVAFETPEMQDASKGTLWRDSVLTVALTDGSRNAHLLFSDSARLLAVKLSKNNLFDVIPNPFRR